MKKTKYKHKFERLVFNNRWKQTEYSRNGDWTILGISQFYSYWNSYCIKLCFFGLDLMVWIKKHKI